MIKFDSRATKPKIGYLAIVTGVYLLIVILMLMHEPLMMVPFQIVTVIFLSIVIGGLLHAFIEQLKYNPYSYNSIYYISFSLLIFSVLVVELFLIFDPGFSSMSDRDMILTMLDVMHNSAHLFMILSAPFIFVFSTGLCISNISLIRHEGRRLVNLLGIILSLLMIGGEIYILSDSYYVSGSHFQVMMHDVINTSFAALYLYYECMVIGTIIVNLIVIRHKPDYDKDFIIILGCGLMDDGSVTPLLKGRADRALRFAREQYEATGKEVTFIASGGQGPDEVNSEAAAIQRYLMEQGVPAERILLEDRSTDTAENMEFSKAIIDSIDPHARVIYSTTNYHIFRSGLKARRVKLKATGIGARTKWYFWPNATVREFVGILTDHKLKQALIIGGMLAYYVGYTLLYYSYF